MHGFITDIERATLDNDAYRSVIYTAAHFQLVVMSLLPGEEIGLETHSSLEQFIRIESGTATVTLGEERFDAQDGTAIVIPAGTAHNVANTGDTALKLYTIYAPPEHKDGTIHQTKADAIADEKDHFDGDTTE